MIWAELATRKASLPFDTGHYLLVELYASWYELFERTRELIKTIPVERLDRQATRDIVDATVGLLNEGMRPHLTKWETYFRAWYEQQVEKAKAEKQGLCAHDLQQKFPGYADLIADLKTANERLIEYRDQLHRLATGS